MKKQLNYVLLLALSAGTLATTSAAQTSTAVNDRQNTRIAQATFNPGQTGLLRLTDWNDHRRGDGDGDRDDRNYRNRDGNGYRGQYYYANPNYGNGYYATPYRGRTDGWYDRNGYWHAYDRDRDRDRRRHDNDDRR
ncbi:MAG: hypothetical protein WBQ76_03350 [Candidatus Korobacteraceae bacterium]